MNKLNDTISKILLLGFSLVLGFTILEVASKMILKTTRIDQKVKHVENNSKHSHVIGSYDAYLGWGYKPGASEKYETSDFQVEYSINSNGFRDQNIPMDKPLNEFRILGLGESTVFGEGINYGRRFTEIIENSLENVQVINMGVWGFGADQSLLQLEREGFQFKPDVVILFVIQDFFERCKLYRRLQAIKPRFVLNDSKNGLVLQDIDFVRNKLEADVHKTESRQPENDLKNSPVHFLEKSSFFALLNSKRKMVEANKIMADQERNHWKNIHKQLKEDSEQYTDNDEDFKKLIFLILKQYKEICDKNSVDFILVFIDMNKEYFLKYLLNPLMSLKIDYLDLSDVLLEASSKKSLRFNVDPHYNESTHGLIGQHVKDYMSKKYHLLDNKGYVYQ